MRFWLRLSILITFLAASRLLAVQSCVEALGGGQSELASDPHEKIFRRKIEKQSETDYQLNIDEAYQKIQRLPEKLGLNNVVVRSMFEYDGEPIVRIDIPSTAKEPLGTIMIWAGVHGNESITSAMLIEFIEELVESYDLRSKYKFTFLPMVNPGGLKKNTRKTYNNTDINRQLEKEKNQKFTNKLIAEFQGESILLGLDLHEAKNKNTFFVIRNQRGDEQYLNQVLASIDSEKLMHSPDGSYPYEVPHSLYQDRRAYLLEGPGVTTSFNSGTGKNFMKTYLKAPLSYTIESGGQIPIEERWIIYKQLLYQFIQNYNLFTP